MHNQDPSPDLYTEIDKKHTRRAKLAAWAAGISLFGGVAAAEIADPQAAQAKAEQAGKMEGPQDLINATDKKLVALEQTMKKDPRLQYYDFELRHKIKEPEHTSWLFLSAKSKKHPGRWDMLLLMIRKGHKVPLMAAMSLGADTSHPSTDPHNANEAMILAQTVGGAGSHGTFLPGWMELAIFKEKPNKKIVSSGYCASTTRQIPASDLSYPPFGVINHSHPDGFAPTSAAVVSHQFERFMTLAEEVVAETH